ncbi:MAG: hypothetical protein K0R55_4003 [Sporomusa sp.]|nr:hypothetical protein [Sporomusa sp.]
MALLDEKPGAWISSQNGIEDFQPAITGDPYILLIKSIITQQLSVKATETFIPEWKRYFSADVWVSPGGNTCIFVRNRRI